MWTAVHAVYGVITGTLVTLGSPTADCDTDGGSGRRRQPPSHDVNDVVLAGVDEGDGHGDRVTEQGESPQMRCHRPEE